MVRREEEKGKKEGINDPVEAEDVKGLVYSQDAEGGVRAERS